MSTEKTYHNLLQKLAEGTITEKERWQLERASLDDPFLADALEGYYSKDGADNTNVVSSPAPKTRSLKWLSIAASLLVLVTASIWVFQQNEPESAVYSAAENSTKRVPQAAPKKGFSKNGNTSQDDYASNEPQEIVAPDKEIASPSSSPNSAGGYAKQAEVAKIKNPASRTEQINTDKTINEEEEPILVELLDEASEAPVVAARDVVRQKKSKARVVDADLAEEVEVVVVEESAPASADQVDGFSKESVREQEKYESGLDQSTATGGNVVALDKIPSIIQGTITDKNGLPLEGVSLLNTDFQTIGLTNQSGVFHIPDENRYVIAAFTGYDSATIALRPEVSVELKPISELFSNRHKTLAEMMDDNELIAWYKERINQQFSNTWPLCNQQNRFQRSNLNVNVHVRIDQQGKIYDLTYMNEVDEQCKFKLEELLNEQSFEINRPVNFLLRINL